MKIAFSFLACLLIALAGCSVNDTAPAPDDGLTDEEFRSAFADRTVYLWDGEDYTAGGDGTFGIDGIGVVIMTLREMGYDLEMTTVDGLYKNLTLASQPFGYTVASNATDGEMADFDFTNLRKGDLIFIDYEFDDVFDHVVVYLATYATITHAAFNASDYYDECVISDLDGVADPLRSDMEWSSVSSRALDHAAIETLFTAT